MIAKNLRIGNQFIEEKTKQIIEVIGLTSSSIVFSGVFEGKWQAKKLPLTDEILEKIGFEKRVGEINTFFHFEDGCFTYILLESGKEGKYCIDIIDTESSRHLTGFGCVDFLHELQNKIFPFNHTEVRLPREAEGKNCIV